MGEKIWIRMIRKKQKILKFLVCVTVEPDLDQKINATFLRILRRRCGEITCALDELSLDPIFVTPEGKKITLSSGEIFDSPEYQQWFERYTKV